MFSIIFSTVFLTLHVNSFAISTSKLISDHQVLIVNEGNSAGSISLSIANNTLTIQIDSKNSGEAYLTLSGALSISKKISSNTIDVTNIQPGYYSLTIQDSEGQISYKLFQVL